MPKFIAGAVFGIIITIAAYSFLGSSSRNGTTPNDERMVTAEASTDAAVVAPHREPTNFEIEEEQEKSDSPLDQSAPTQMSDALPVNAGQPAPSTPANSEPTSAPINQRDYSEYPPEIADILDTDNPRALQTEYEADEKEDSWATYMENQLANYFAGKPELAQFNISRIDCRTSICEIQAIGYGDDASTAWTVATADIIQQTWHDFRRMSATTRNPAPGVFAVVLVLAREAE